MSGLVRECFIGLASALWLTVGPAMAQDAEHAYPYGPPLEFFQGSYDVVGQWLARGPDVPEFFSDQVRLTVGLTHRLGVETCTIGTGAIRWQTLKVDVWALRGEVGSAELICNDHVDNANYPILTCGMTVAQESGPDHFARLVLWPREDFSAADLACGD